MNMSTKLCVGVFDAHNTIAHNFAMNVAHALRAMMEKLDFNQTEMAARLGGGISQPQVSRWLKGAEPERANYERITALAQQLGVLNDDMRSEDVAAGLAERAEPRMVKLKGYVGAGSQAHYYALADEDYEEVEAPASATDQTVAVEIKGTSLGPLLDTWLVFYSDVRAPVTDDLIGQLCVVGLDDDRILIKKIQRNGRGGFNLYSNNAVPPIENARIEWAAKVTDMRPRR